MDNRLRKLLDDLPTVTSRSKLEPYADVISELRGKRWSYSRIATFLWSTLNFRVAASTVHSFVRARIATDRNGGR